MPGWAAKVSLPNYIQWTISNDNSSNGDAYLRRNIPSYLER